MTTTKLQKATQRKVKLFDCDSRINDGRLVVKDHLIHVAERMTKISKTTNNEDDNFTSDFVKCCVKKKK